MTTHIYHKPKHLVFDKGRPICREGESIQQAEARVVKVREDELYPVKYHYQCNECKGITRTNKKQTEKDKCAHMLCPPHKKWIVCHAGHIEYIERGWMGSWSCPKCLKIRNTWTKEETENARIRRVEQFGDLGFARRSKKTQKELERLERIKEMSEAMVIALEVWSKNNNGGKQLVQEE